MVGGMLQNADSTVGVGAELTAIAVVVVGGTSLMGGRGNLFGTVCAAFLLASVKAGLNIANVSSKYEGLVFGGILIIALMADGLRRGGAGRACLWSRPQKGGSVLSSALDKGSLLRPWRSSHPYPYKGGKDWRLDSQSDYLHLLVLSRP